MAVHNSQSQGASRLHLPGYLPGVGNDVKELVIWVGTNRGSALHGEEETLREDQERVPVWCNFTV